MTRDEFVRKLWLDGYEFTDEHPQSTRFMRPSDGAVVLVPKTETLDFSSEERTPHLSPCCEAESHVRRIVGGLILMRCSACQHLWERQTGPERRLKLVM